MVKINKNNKSSNIEPSEIKLYGLSWTNETYSGKNEVRILFIKRDSKRNEIARETTSVTYNELFEYAKVKKQVVRMNEAKSKIQFIDYKHLVSTRNGLRYRPKAKWIDIEYWLSDFAPAWLFKHLLVKAMNSERIGMAA